MSNSHMLALRKRKAEVSSAMRERGPILNESAKNYPGGRSCNLARSGTAERASVSLFNTYHPTNIGSRTSCLLGSFMSRKRIHAWVRFISTLTGLTLPRPSLCQFHIPNEFPAELVPLAN